MGKLTMTGNPLLDMLLGAIILAAFGGIVKLVGAYWGKGSEEAKKLDTRLTEEVKKQEAVVTNLTRKIETTEEKHMNKISLFESKLDSKFSEFDDKFGNRIAEIFDNINTRLNEFNKKMDSYNTDYTSKMHELELLLVQKYASKEDVNALAREIQTLREQVKENTTTNSLYKEQVKEVQIRVGKVEQEMHVHPYKDTEH